MKCVVCGKDFETEEDVCPTCREIVKNKKTLNWFRKMRKRNMNNNKEVNENEI